MGQGVRVRVGGVPRGRAGSKNVLSQGGEKCWTPQWEAPQRRVQEARDLSRQPEGLSHSLKLPPETEVQGCARDRGAVQLPSRRDLPGKAWLLLMAGPLRIGLEPDFPTERPALPPGTERYKQRWQCHHQGQLVLGCPLAAPSSGKYKEHICYLSSPSIPQASLRVSHCSGQGGTKWKQPVFIYCTDLS